MTESPTDLYERAQDLNVPWSEAVTLRSLLAEVERRESLRETPEVGDYVTVRFNKLTWRVEEVIGGHAILRSGQTGRRMFNVPLPVLTIHSKWWVYEPGEVPYTEAHMFTPMKRIALGLLCCLAIAIAVPFVLWGAR